MKREKKKAAGPLAGIFMIFIGIILLWNNEGNNVKNIKTIEEARGSLVNVSSEKVDSANEGKLVSTNGKIEIGDEYLIDSVFNVQSPKTAKLVRVVEMYQWVEEEKEDDEGYVTYSYKKEWKEEIEDSSRFNDSTKDNPTTMPYQGEVFYASDVTLGAFTLSSEQKALLDTKAMVSLGETVSLPAGYYKVNNYIASIENLTNAKVGDVRISFRYNDDKEISVLAKQSGSSFLPYISKQNKTMFEVKKGIMTGEEIIDAVEAENNMVKWFLRLLGVMLNMAGFAALLSPVAFLVKWIPLLGKGIAKVIGWIGGLIGFIVSMLIIAVAWLFYRPIISIILFVLVGGAIFLIVKLIKKSRGMETPVQGVVAGVPGMTMAMPTGNVQQPTQPQVVMQQPGMSMQPQMVQQQPAMQPQQMMPQQQPMMQSQQMMPHQPFAQPQMAQQQPMMQPQQMMPQQPVAQPQMVQQQPMMQPQQMMPQQPQDPMSNFGQNNNQQ